MKIQVTLISASDIKNVDIFPNSKLYAVAWIEDGSRPAKQKTAAKENNTNPTWDKLMCFILDEEALEQDRLSLKLEVRTEETKGSKKAGRINRMKKATGSKKVGDVSIPIKYLAKSKTVRAEFWSYRVRNPSGEITGKLNLTLQVIKPESESNAKGSSVPQGKKRKRDKVPLSKPEPKSNAKENAAPKRKKRNKVALTTSTEFAPPTIDPPLLRPPPHQQPYSYPQYPLQQPYPHQSGPGYNLSSGYPPYPSYYPQQAGCPPYPPDYPQQACYPPYTPHAAAPLPPLPLPHTGYMQYLRPGGEYPLQQSYPQQGGSNTNSGYSGW